MSLLTRVKVKVGGISLSVWFTLVAMVYVLVIMAIFARSSSAHSNALGAASRRVCEARNAAVAKNVDAMQGLREGSLEEEHAYRIYLANPKITAEAKALINVSLRSAVNRVNSWTEMINVQRTGIVDCSTLTG